MAESFASELQIGDAARLACLLEVSVPKAGNVHPKQSFPDCDHLDFLVSALAIAPALELAPGRGLGETILDCIRRTRRVTAANTNLGIVLLLAPLASCYRELDFRAALRLRLGATTVEDAELTYRAIRLAAPGGLGRVEQEDVAGPPSRTLRDVMALAASRDSIAEQYVSGFRCVLDEGCVALGAALSGGMPLAVAVRRCHLELLARRPDSLIARKSGVAVAEEASRRAGDVLASGWPATAASRSRHADLDAWLRSDGNRRNPGTTADLTAASLFLALRDGIIPFPLHRDALPDRLNGRLGGV